MPLVLASCPLVFFPTAILAQGSEKTLDEITVTAQRRQVDIQDAAVAVSVLSGADFDESNIVRLDNFNGYIPGLTVAKNDGAGRVVAIRGVGWETAQNLSTQPSVLMYVDGVYMANPLAIGVDLGELERIEVFRGPQGTEFGQGSTGGAINLVTIKPDFEQLSGNAELTVGTYNLVRARGAINIPLGSSAGVRVSLQKNSHDGYSEIQGGNFDSYELDDADTLTGKISMLWKPADAWSVYLSAFLHDGEQNAAAQRNVDEPANDARTLSQDFPGVFELENQLYSAIIEWGSASGLLVKSITGYQKLNKKQSVDGDRLNEALTSIDIFGFVVTTANWDVLTFWDNDSEAFSQELNFSYSGDTFDWVAGGYYLNHENFNYFLEANGPSPFEDSIPALSDPGPDTLPPFMSVLNFVEARTVTREDWAVYGQVRFQLNEQVRLIAGGRYQTERQLDEAVQFWDIESTQRLDDSKFTWKFGIDYKLSPSNLVYGLISTGWKNGGTNPGALNGAINVPTEFRPAEVTSFEIGSRNSLADESVRLNISAFFNDYENLQFMEEDPVPFAGGTGNIPGTQIYGIETEITWLLADSWQVDGQLTWMDGTFTEDFTTLDVVDFREALAPGVGLFTPAGFDVRLDLSQNTNLKGNIPPKLVDWSARLALTNSRNFDNNATLVSRLEFVYRGNYQYRVFNNPLVDAVPSYAIINLLFRYEFTKQDLSVGVAATNLLDEAGVNSRFSNPFGLLTTSEEYIPPREVFVTLRYNF